MSCRGKCTHTNGVVCPHGTSQRGKNNKRRKNYWKKYEGRLWNDFFLLSREHFWPGCRPSVPYIQQPAMEELRCSPPPPFHTGLRTCRINICRGKKTENCVGFPFPPNMRERAYSVTVVCMMAVLHAVQHILRSRVPIRYGGQVELHRGFTYMEPSLYLHATCFPLTK